MKPADSQVVAAADSRPRQLTQAINTAAPMHSSKARRGMYSTPKPGHRFSKVSRVLSTPKARPKRSNHGRAERRSGEAEGSAGGGAWLTWVRQTERASLPDGLKFDDQLYIVAHPAVGHGVV